MGRGKEKEVCKDCPNRYRCVELIYSEICPSGLTSVPLIEARRIQKIWKLQEEGTHKICGDCKGAGKVVCPRCKGKGVISKR